MRTPTQRLADILLGEPVESWVAQRRNEGKSWRRISNELRDETKGDIDVAPPTLISWATEAEHAEQAS